MVGEHGVSPICISPKIDVLREACPQNINFGHFNREKVMRPGLLPGLMTFSRYIFQREPRKIYLGFLRE